jgi:hypothetical protein
MFKVIVTTLVIAVFAFVFGFYEGHVENKADPAITCVKDTYEVIDKPGCFVDGLNLLSGNPDGETGWFKDFDQIGVCGNYACQGQAQGTYECFERNQLKRVDEVR